MNKALFQAAAMAHGLPMPEPEVRFAPPRKWRFDWLWKEHSIAIEIQGGLFTGGRHVRGKALLAEYEKINEAQIMGYKVLLVTPEQVNSGEAFALVKRCMEEAS
jgi:hypothetical protein